jgi:hypothetical protein
MGYRHGGIISVLMKTVVDGMVLINACVGVPHGSEQQPNEIVPSFQNKVCIEGEDRVVFVLRSAVRNHHQGACISR